MQRDEQKPSSHVEAISAYITAVVCQVKTNPTLMLQHLNIRPQAHAPGGDIIERSRTDGLIGSDLEILSLIKTSVQNSLTADLKLCLADFGSE